MSNGKKGRTNLPQTNISQYLIAGAGLGLYQAIVFNPSPNRVPSVQFAFGGAIMIAIVTSIIRAVRKNRPPFKNILGSFPVVFVMYFATLLLLESRRWVLTQGGRFAVILAMVVGGGLLGGLLYANRRHFGLK